MVRIIAVGLVRAAPWVVVSIGGAGVTVPVPRTFVGPPLQLFSEQQLVHAKSVHPGVQGVVELEKHERVIVVPCPGIVVA